MYAKRIPNLPVTDAKTAANYVVTREPGYTVGAEHAAEKVYWFKFTVVGRGEFPFDMLRYDMAFPANSESAAAMAEPYGRPVGSSPRKVDLCVITTRPNYLPTFARWASFGWVVKSDA